MIDNKIDKGNKPGKLKKIIQTTNGKLKIIGLILIVVLLLFFSGFNQIGFFTRLTEQKEHEQYMTEFNEAISQFQMLLGTGDNQAVKTLVNSETDEYISAQYKTMVLSYIMSKSETALEQYNNNDIGLEQTQSEIQELYGILDEIACLNIADEYVSALKESEDNYLKGRTLYNNYDYPTARVYLNAVDINNQNYEDAQNLIDTIEQYDEFWDSRQGKNSYGAKRDSILLTEGYIYFPYRTNDINIIIKLNPDTEDIDIFPLCEMKDDYVICGINIVGEYIYFVAGENVGKGYTTNNPYNIFRMKTDGTDLLCVAEGDYFDLICYDDIFYALSYTEGLIKFDRYFQNKIIVKNDDVVSMYPCAEGIYYTQRNENEFLSEDTEYFYNGDYHTKIYEGEQLRCYYYDDDIVFTEYGYNNSELISKTKAYDFEDNRKYYYIDIRKYIGRMDNLIVLLSSDDDGQDIYITYHMVTRRAESYTEIDELPDYKINSICSEKNIMLLEKSDGMYLTDITLKNQAKIDIPEINSEELTANQAQLKIKTDDEWFTDEEYIYIRNDFWHYSDSTLFITIEKDYMPEIDSTIYITHIKTNGEDKLSIGYQNGPPGNKEYSYNLAAINRAIFAVNGDFWSEENNPWTGIVIRDGEVYKDKLKSDMVAFYPDGSIECYTAKDDPITAEELLSQGVIDTMSFGPELLDDYQYGKVDEHFLSGSNPRTALGMIEPNHYIIISCDGRSFRSRGVTLRKLADIFMEYGCSEAYNLDGGQSTSILFMGELLNSHSDDFGYNYHRRMYEILYIGTSDQVKPYVAPDDSSD